MMDINARPNRRLRCAIYTRKSSEEGLDMEFNSLDAQREACEAYIASQRSEGWIATRERYDDGGFSGGKAEKQPLFSSGSLIYVTVTRAFGIVLQRFLFMVTAQMKTTLISIVPFLRPKQSTYISVSTNQTTKI